MSVSLLGSTVIQAVVDRSGIDPGRIDEVILGQCYPNSEYPAIGRSLALSAGLPVTVSGVQIDRRCGSGLQAIADAVARVESGLADVVLAGGVESMSAAEHYVLGARWGLNGTTEFVDRIARGRVTSGGDRHRISGGMLETAENLRREYQISRHEQDAFALRSHHKAILASDSGHFEREIEPVLVPALREELISVAVDEHPRPGLSIEALQKLRPVLASTDIESTVTAGNSSGQNDGAAICLVTTEEIARSLNSSPGLRMLSWGVAGVEPSRMGIGPVPATDRALTRAGVSLQQLDVIEINEAFAAQVLAVLREWRIDPEDKRINPRGSGISLGHPVGATGARIVATLAHTMQDEDLSLAIATLCAGGGQGVTAVFERVL